jgi:hypothetical protein
MSLSQCLFFDAVIGRKLADLILNVDLHVTYLVGYSVRQSCSIKRFGRRRGEAGYVTPAQLGRRKINPSSFLKNKVSRGLNEYESLETGLSFFLSLVKMRDI